jgi:hypothetical protein
MIGHEMLSGLVIWAKALLTAAVAVYAMVGFMLMRRTR